LAVLKVLSDPAVTKFHDLDTFTKIEEAIALIERRTERFNSRRGIRWGITLKQDNNLIGSCGFMWNQLLDSAEVGYELASNFWKQEIMTEALKSILEFGFQHVQLKFVVAEVMLENLASKKLLEKLGF
jgi:ribosomal-protein-alanine N-acetyltransferase